MQETADYLGFGEVAEWFKAAVLKTASREHRHPAQNLETRQSPSRNGRVLHPFAQNMAEHMSAQSRSIALAYRSGIRHALAEVTILRVEAMARITEKPARANADRRAQVRAYSVAAKRLNALMLEPEATPSPQNDRRGCGV